MKKLIIISLLLALAGCSSDIPNKAYYQLGSDLNDSKELQTRKVNDIVYIEEINVANYLDQTGIIYQTNPNEYITANNNLWLTSLSNQIKQRLVQDLSVLLPNYLVTTQTPNKSKFSIKLFIDSFHGVYTGDAVIKGRWLITNSHNEVITKNFDQTLRLTDDGYLALVKALSIGWQNEEKDLVKSVKF